MKNHITHFDDCGCLTSKYEDQIEDLELRYQAAINELIKEHKSYWIKTNQCRFGETHKDCVNERIEEEFQRLKSENKDTPKVEDMMNDQINYSD